MLGYDFGLYVPVVVLENCVPVQVNRAVKRVHLKPSDRSICPIEACD